MRVDDSYIKLDVSDLGEAYVKKSVLNQLKAVNAAIFDCDGVLIDARNSYNMAIAKTVAYILEGLTGITLPKGVISNEVIISFKRSGGFNSDWDLAYAILMFTISRLPRSFWETFKRYIESPGRFKDPLEAFRTIRERVTRRPIIEEISNAFLKDLGDELVRFAEALDEDGIESVDRKLRSDPKSNGDIRRLYGEMKRFLRYPGGIGESVISTVFEEFFRGPKLFKESCGQEPRFNRRERGLIDLEKVIIKPETLDVLEELFEGPRFGVASGSFLRPAQYILGNLLERFNPEALVFYDEVFRAELEASRKSGVSVSLKKPNPFSLFRSARSLEPFSYAVYVGDSMEDALTVEKARERDPRFLFVGVYYHSPPRDATLRDFLAARCDVVLPTVNELPSILELSRRGQ
ncbi:MAG: hypothetical protein AYL32_002960 [Candidatus Bathyarchaeota archaeon B26-2]|nr:MAG: hypothetical protein AYL32_002960 [Candidatus Bathyarchaeota archaeon B26-2]